VSISEFIIKTVLGQCKRRDSNRQRRKKTSFTERHQLGMGALPQSGAASLSFSPGKFLTRINFVFTYL